ncbi:hypothetical protein GS597_06525 [Synechococcales cyanobacterium C]|uniref:Uncharacterized protein n=1 Tax=Petrachloros mirabilis ULC683 TaxID=2781853 RepID=A0A8K1ZXY7_9CYAN|nr:hypothetical protein [Petrachloros mirabilis]NCJ06177.1 hypothetical protein [Petrachloros mirabilis ULC683]
MFFDELSPLLQELIRKPVAFLGGFASGALRLSLNDDPVKSWLDREFGAPSPTTPSVDESNNGNGPQSIIIE